MLRLAPPINLATHVGPVQYTTAPEVFPNLAGRPGSSIAQQAPAIVKGELEAAGIPTIPAFANPNGGEVMANNLGVLSYGKATVVIQRLWHYYAVTSDQPLPHLQSRDLHRLAGRVIRTDGYAGGRKPAAYTGVSHWNVDTSSGLKMLVRSLNDYFGQPENPPRATVADLEQIQTGPSPFYNVLIGRDRYRDPHVTAYSGNIPGTQSPVTPEFLNIFENISDPNIVMDATIMAAVQTLTPGTVSRFYFEEGDRRIRLSIWRKEDGSWVCGSTSFDLMTVNESYRNRNDSFYSTNEYMELTDPRYRNSDPFTHLRFSLSYIHNEMARAVVRDRYEKDYQKWAAAIPEDANNGEIQELLLHSLGLRYNLIRGSYYDPYGRLTDNQVKMLTAIQYLTKNDLTFWSYNAGASGVAEGIYRRGEKSIGNRWLVGYDFDRALFEAMENAGLNYVDGKWKQAK